MGNTWPIVEWESLWELHEGRVNVAELCRPFGVSRKTGQKWLRRYQEAGRDLAVLEDRERRPHSNPKQTPEAIEDGIVAARKAHPTWGPKKLKRLVERFYPDVDFFRRRRRLLAF